MLHVALQREKLAYKFLELGKKDCFLRYQIKVKVAKSGKTLHIYLCSLDKDKFKMLHKRGLFLL